MANSENNTSSDEKSTSNPFSRALKVFLRLLVAIMVGLSIGLGLYFGGVTLYRIAVGPGPSYDQQLQDYQEEVAQLRIDLAERDLEIDEQQSELERLINDGADLNASQSEAINEQMTVLAAELAMLTDRLDTLEVSLSEVGQPFDEMQGQLQLIQAMTLLSRAQFWLSEDNLGQASEDVTSARAMIFAQAEKWREETEYGDRVTVLDEIVSRLDIALEDIRTQPSIAEDEIEIAWKLLIVVTAPEHLGAE
jgi:predicted RNase H-like nuclease (RuvC/YqgF family)